MNAVAETIETTDETMSAIDAAIAKAKARAARRGTDDSESSRKKMTPGERAEKQAELKNQREQRKAQKLADKTAAGPVHMKKVEKAASSLPSLNDNSQQIYDNIINSLPSDQVSAIALHLQHHNRVESTKRAVAAGPMKVGQVVRITGGDPKFIGLTGALERVQRIRCYVRVPSNGRLVYCFTSDVQRIEEEGQDVPQTESLEEEAPVSEPSEQIAM